MPCPCLSEVQVRGAWSRGALGASCPGLWLLCPAAWLGESFLVLWGKAELGEPLGADPPVARAWGCETACQASSGFGCPRGSGVQAGRALNGKGGAFLCPLGAWPPHSWGAGRCPGIPCLKLPSPECPSHTAWCSSAQPQERRAHSHCCLGGEQVGGACR